MSSSFIASESPNGQTVYTANVEIAIPLPTLPGFPISIPPKLPKIKLPGLPPALTKLGEQMQKVLDKLAKLQLAVPELALHLKVKVGPLVVLDETVGTGGL